MKLCKYEIKLKDFKVYLHLIAVYYLNITLYKFCSWDSFIDILK